MLSQKKPDDVIKTLESYLTAERKERIEQVIGNRTRTVVTVVEGLINSGNVSAVMRTAEALGFMDLHVIAGDDIFKNSPTTSQGADKWVEVQEWENAEACIAMLKADGYRIVATHLDETSVPIAEIDFTQKTALVLGNEVGGLSEKMLELADTRCIIPMAGFVQSFNISVAAAVSLYHAYQDRMRRQRFHGDLSDEEKQEVRALYYYRSVRAADALLRGENT